jgi:peptidoglycan glycosyltransferase
MRFYSDTIKMRFKRRNLFTFIMSALVGSAMFFGGWYFGYRSQAPKNARSPFANGGFFSSLYSKEEIKKKLSAQGTEAVFRFEQNEVQLDGWDEPVVLDFAFDPAIQSVSEDLLNQYKPDLASMVVMDASTGRVLAMVGQNRSFEMEGYPALRASYPAASVFKVITATAAIENKSLRASSLIPFSGRSHTLYKSQVLRPDVVGWRRMASLKEAFAHSINTVFGRMGVFDIGQKPLQSMADRFGFNSTIPSEFPVETSKSAHPNSAFELAEMASGFTQHNTLSPLHGAMIAAAIANNGDMMEPYFLNSAYLRSGKTIYRSEPILHAKVMTPEVAAELRNLMRETVLTGTSKKSFKGFFKGSYRELDVGGKTGSLTDQAFKGKVDWFVGFAQAHGRKVAVSVLTMNKKYWTVKSSYLARKALETTFSAKAVAKNR